MVKCLPTLAAHIKVFTTCFAALVAFFAQASHMARGAVWVLGSIFGEAYSAILGMLT